MIEVLRPKQPNLISFGRVLFGHVKIPLAVLLGLFILSTTGYYLLGLYHGTPWTLLDCAYMTSITLTTVGYGDTLGASDFVLGKIYTMGVAVIGLGGTLYSVSFLSVFFFEGKWQQIARKMRMQNQVIQLRNHTIICGAGQTGRYVIKELVLEKKPLVVIDKDEEKLSTTQDSHPGILTIHKNATKEETLEEAGIEHAENLVAALDDDKENLFLVISARWLNKKVNIISKCTDAAATGKFLAAGANHVVNPALIGGMRISAHLLKPHYFDLVDKLVDNDEPLKIEEIEVKENSKGAGKMIAYFNFEKDFRIILLAIKSKDSPAGFIQPSASTIIQPGSKIVALGSKERLLQLKTLFSA